jgi:hypothetical protein
MVYVFKIKQIYEYLLTMGVTAKKIIRLTESDLEKIVLKVIEENSVIGALNYGMRTNKSKLNTSVRGTNPKFEELSSVLYSARDTSWADGAAKTLFNNKQELKIFGAAIINWAIKNRSYDGKLLKGAISFIFRESKGTFATYASPKEIIGAVLNLFGGNHSQGFGQIQPETAKRYGIDVQSLYTFEGALDAVYKILSVNYQRAKKYYKGTTVTIFENGNLKQIPAIADDAAFHIAVAAHNAGEGIINQWCETNKKGIANICTVKQRQVYDNNPKSIAITDPSKKIPNYFPNIGGVHNYMPQFITSYNMLSSIPSLIPQSLIKQ